MSKLNTVRGLATTAQVRPPGGCPPKHGHTI